MNGSIAWEQDDDARAMRSWQARRGIGRRKSDALMTAAFVAAWSCLAGVVCGLCAYKLWKWSTAVL